MLLTRALGLSQTSLRVYQNLTFMSSVIHKVGFCLANVFYSNAFVNVNLFLWTDITDEYARLFSLIYVHIIYIYNTYIYYIYIIHTYTIYM